MKKTVCLILLSSTIFLGSCNNNNQVKDFTVEFISNTLTINNLVAKENTDYEATIDFKEENYNYCLPNKISLYINNNHIDSSLYSYDNKTGDILIGRELITNNLKIIAERQVIDGYQINFETDSHIHFYFYKTRDYSITPIEDTIAIARDLSGNPTMDGTGEVNFKYEIDNNYEKDLFWIHGISDEIEEVQTGIYRIANIKDNVRVCTNTKKIYCKNLCASADYNNKSFTFNWDVDSNLVDSVDIDVIHGSETKHDNITSVPYTFNDDGTVTEEELYQFAFTPVLKDGSKGDPIKKDMMLSPNSKVGFPRVEITTENNLLPHYEVCNSSSTGGNASVVNSKPINNIIQIYDDENDKQYDSSEGQAVGEEYEGSKLIVYGDEFTVNSNGKESYVLELTNQADLLDPFLNRSGQAGGDAYQDKEWLLINCGNKLNQLGGLSIEKSLNTPWIPQCQYVTLFMNNDFKGLYVLSESINKGNKSGEVQARCPIEESGFIIENNGYAWKEDLSFKTRINLAANAMEYTFRYPDSSDLSYEDSRYKYIDKYVNDFENYFYQSDPQYSNYVDVESFARWTVAHDLMHVDDFIGSNMYIYKKDNTDSSKLTAGTTWDFDSAFIGNESGTKGLCHHRSSNFYYIGAFKNIDEFKTDTQTIFDAAKDNIINDFNNYIDYISNKKDIYNALLTKETLRFGKPQVEFNPQKEQIEHYLNVQINYIKSHPYVGD